MTADPVADHLRALHLRNLRESTIRQRRLCLARFRRFTGQPLLEATPEQLSAFLERPLSPEGRATETSHLRQFFAWAVKMELLVRDPASHLVRPRLPRRLPRPMEPADLVHAVHRAPERIRPWLFLAAYCGLRAHEVAGLRREDLLTHYDPPMLMVVDGKGGKQRLIPMAAELVAEVRTWDMPRSGWLFTRRDGAAGHVPAHLVSQLTNEYLRDEGIGATMHQVRHLFGTTMYRRTNDLRLVQELLGHSSPNTTAGYAAWSPEKAAEAVRDLDYGT